LAFVDALTNGSADDAGQLSPAVDKPPHELCSAVCQEETFRHSLRVTGARKYQRSDSDYRVPRDWDELVTSAGLLHMTEGRE
jgi:hypothetical protein